MVAKVFTVPFALDGNKNVLPNPAPGSGAVSYDSGFGADYSRQLGIDPLAKNIAREDFNGLNYDITTALQEMQAGEGVSAFSAALAAARPGAGYAKGAVIPRTDLNGFWASTSAANADNPEVTFGKWVPVDVQGSFTQALTNVNVTLSLLNAGFPQLIFTGTLTGNVNVIVPAWLYNYRVTNNCTGAFTVTVKTAAGTGVVIPNGSSQLICVDGTNVVFAVQPLTGRLYRTLRYSLVTGVLNVSVNGGANTTVGASSYIPTPGMLFVDVEGVGGGGAGGGAVNPTAGNVALGAPGASGSYGRSIYTAAQIGASQAVTVGAGGIGVSSTTGGVGGTTSLGALLTLPGGSGGLSSAAGGVVTPSLLGGNTGTSAPTGTNLNANTGFPGGPSIAMAATTVGSYGGQGGGNLLGIPTPFAGANTAGNPGTGYGTGGSGLCILNGSGPANGPNGAAGVLIIREYI